MPSLAFALACAASSGAPRVIDFQADAGAVPCAKTLLKACDSSTSDAVDNANKMNRALASLAPGDVLKVPNSTFLMMGGVYASGLKAATLQIDGTLLWSDDIKAWPTEVKHNQTTKMPITAISIESTVGFTITSSGTGLLNGNGAAWWGLPGIGYLERG